MQHSLQLTTVGFVFLQASTAISVFNHNMNARQILARTALDLTSYSVLQKFTFENIVSH